MMTDTKAYYFKNDKAWREWLHQHHQNSSRIYLIFYKVAHENESMRWEEAVRVALCYGWIVSTVKSLGDGKRRQWFCPRKPKSVWSKVNKIHIQELLSKKLMHESGLNAIKIAKANGSWSSLDDVENGVIPQNIKLAFQNNKLAYTNFKGFTKSQKKGYLYWLNQAKREETKEKRINEIIRLCEANEKYRTGSPR